VERREQQNLSFAGRGCFGPVSAAAVATNEHKGSRRDRRSSLNRRFATIAEREEKRIFKTQKRRVGVSLHETQSQPDDEQGYNTQAEVSVARLDREGKQQNRKRRRKGENEAKSSLILVQNQRQQGHTHTKHHKNITRTQTEGGEKTKKRKRQKNAPRDNASTKTHEQPKLSRKT